MIKESGREFQVETIGEPLSANICSGKIGQNYVGEALSGNTEHGIPKGTLQRGMALLMTPLKLTLHYWPAEQ